MVELNQIRWTQLGLSASQKRWQQSTFVFYPGAEQASEHERSKAQFSQITKTVASMDIGSDCLLLDLARG